MARETQKKGDIAKAVAISRFTQMGFDVAILLTESASYDLIVDIGTQLVRVQVKYTTGSYVDMRRIHSNSRGYVVKSYKESSYDWLFIYRPEYGEYLIKEIPDCSCGFTLREEWRLE